MKLNPKDLTPEARQRYTVADNTFTRTVKADPRDEITLEIGDSKQASFYPQAKIMRWGNEVNFSIRRQKQWKRPTVRTEGDMVAYGDADEEVHIYEKPEVGEDGGLEIELLLKTKPSTNQFVFTLQTKGLAFYYQPELTPEEIAQGRSRPDNVVGSYAVYHLTKRHSHAGGLNYKTGKAFHIYRPHITDASGKETWGSLSVDEESQELTVSVPQDFLDTALYPVLVDPTFGYTSIGASTSAWATGTVGSDGQVYSPSEDGSVYAMSLYGNAWSGNDPCDLKTAIYDSSGNLVAESKETSINGTVGWKELLVDSTSISSSTDYLLAHHPSAWIDRYYDSGVGANSSKQVSATYPTFPDPVSWTNISSKDLFSLYASYTDFGQDPATIATNAVSSIMATSAIGNGTISEVTGGSVDERGFVYSTSSQPNPGDVTPNNSDYSSVVNESGSYSNGEFSLSLTGLSEGTRYFVRAYIHTTAGYTYGSEAVFTTIDRPTPTYYTTPVQITDTGMIFGVGINDTGGSEVTEIGVVLSTSDHSDPGNTDPEVSDYEYAFSTSGSFEDGLWGAVTATGLNPETTYYHRAYAKSIAGYRYTTDSVTSTTNSVGEVVISYPSFTTLRPIGGGSSFDYFAQSFIAPMDTITEYGLRLREFEPEGEVQMGLFPSDGSGTPDLGNPLHISDTIDPESTSQIYTESGLSIAVNKGNKYFVAAITPDTGTGSAAASLTPVPISTGEALFYTNNDGASWNEYVSAMVIHLKGTYSVDELVTPTVQSHTLSLYSPTITTQRQTTITLTTQSLSASLHSPAITASQNATVNPATQSLTINQSSPTVAAVRSVTIEANTHSLSLTQHQAIVTAVQSVAVEPTTQSLALTQHDPEAAGSRSVTVSPATQSLSLSQHTPQVATGTGVSVEASPQSLTQTLHQPAVVAVRTVAVTPDTQSLSQSLYTPTITAQQQVTIAPATHSLTLSQHAPQIAASVNTTIDAPTQSLILTSHSPQVAAVRTVEVEVSSQSLIAGIHSPSVQTAQNITIEPDSQSLSLTQQPPETAAERYVTLTPDTQSLSISVHTPAISLGDGVSIPATTQHLQTAIYPPSVAVQRYVTVAPDTQNLTQTLHQPDIGEGQGIGVELSTQSLGASLYSPTITAQRQISVEVGVQPLEVSLWRPSTDGSVNATAQPQTAGVTMSQHSLEITTAQNVSLFVDTQSMSVTLNQPGIQTFRNVDVALDTQSMSLSPHSPTVGAEDVCITTLFAPRAPLFARRSPMFTSRAAVMSARAPLASPQTPLSDPGFCWPDTSYLLTERGNRLVTEDGDYLILEDGVSIEWQYLFTEDGQTLLTEEGDRLLFPIA